MSVLASDGRALIVAMDHAQTHGVIEGLQDPGAVLNSVIEAGADGIMTTYGVMKKYRNLVAGRVPVTLRLDGGPSLYREDWL
ncbi:MAG: fructose-bisphosphate aldolase, partial [Caldilinea sp.]|nr:fructose-bisphosphate aldolase [Caldilinea sp.]